MIIKKMQLVFWVLGFSFILGSAVSMWITFLKAYFNDGKSVHVYVDRMGEADFEIVMIFIGMFICVYLVNDFVNWVVRRRVECLKK